MIDPFLVPINLYTGFQQFFDIRTGTPMCQPGLMRQQQSDIHPAHRSRLQGIQCRLSGHKIRCRNKNISFRHIDQRKIRLLNGSPVTIRSRSNRLHDNIIIGLMVGQVFILIQQQFLPDKIPVDQENHLQRSHDFPGHFQVGISPNAYSGYSVHITIGDIQPPDKSHFSIHDGNFPMVPVIGFIRQMVETYRQKGINLYIGFPQFPDKLLGQAP